METMTREQALQRLHNAKQVKKNLVDKLTKIAVEEEVKYLSNNKNDYPQQHETASKRLIFHEFADNHLIRNN